MSGRVLFLKHGEVPVVNGRVIYSARHEFRHALARGVTHNARTNISNSLGLL